MMNGKQRLEAVIAGRTPDRLATLGGWISYPRDLITLSNLAEADYNRDRNRVAIAAYQNLGVDGLLGYIANPDLDSFQDWEWVSDTSLKQMPDRFHGVEEAAEFIELMPSAEEVEDTFAFEEEYLKFRENLVRQQAVCGDMLYLEPQWGTGAQCTWYVHFGFENWFLIVGLYPHLYSKLLAVGGADGYNKSRLIARAVEEGIHPKAVLLGDDICGKRGPMISMEWLENGFAPQLKRGLAPLLDVGCRPVWHSDGDIRPIIPLLIDSGIEGFQGFQPECGVTLDDMVKVKPKSGNKVLIFGPMAVTTELAVLSPSEIRERVRKYADTAAGDADLALFTSNTTTPDLPLENIVAMYDEAKKIQY